MKADIITYERGGPIDALHVPEKQLIIRHTPDRLYVEQDLHITERDGFRWLGETEIGDEIVAALDDPEKIQGYLFEVTRLLNPRL